MILNTAIFTATIEAAKTKAANNPAVLRAIDRAVVEIQKAKYWAFDGNTLTIQSTTSSTIYRVDAAHTCPAQSKICKHHIARLLMVRYSERLASVEQAPPPPLANESKSLIAEIEATWRAEGYTPFAIATGLVRRFGVNHLSLVPLPYLHQLRAAQVRRLSA